MLHKKNNYWKNNPQNFSSIDKEYTKKYLIINADDFGLTKEVTDGIIYAFIKGCVTSTSIIPVIDNQLLKYTAEKLKENPELDYGIHITLCSDQVVGARYPLYKPFQKILKNSQFPFASLKLLLYYSQTKNIQIIKNEIELQIQKILDSGLHPTHINSHYYIADIPNVCQLIIEAAIKYKIPAIRLSKEKVQLKHFLQLNPLPKIFMLNILGIINDPKIKKANLLTSHHYFGAFHSGRMNEKNLYATIKNLEPGITEVLVHPSLKDSTYFNETRELEACTSKKVLDLIKDENIILTNFRKLNNDENFGLC